MHSGGSVAMEHFVLWVLHPNGRVPICLPVVQQARMGIQNARKRSQSVIRRCTYSVLSSVPREQNSRVFVLRLSALNDQELRGRSLISR